MASIHTAKMPDMTRGKYSRRSRSTPWRCIFSSMPDERICANAMPSGRVRRSATNRAAVRGISSSTSTRTTISSA
ncbi:hypothetical protein D3C72_2019120 [compost metagenome]